MTILDTDTFPTDTPVWAAGNYKLFARVLDPVDGRRFFRRIAGSGATRPALDYNNWSLDGFGPAPTALGMRPINYGALYTTNSYPYTHTGPADGASKAGALQLSVPLPTANTSVDVLSLTGRGVIDVLGVVAAPVGSQNASSTTYFTLLIDGVAITTDFALSCSAMYSNNGSYPVIPGSGSLIGGPQFSVGDVVFPIGWNPYEVRFERSLVLRARCTLGGGNVAIYPRYKLIP